LGVFAAAAGFFHGQGAAGGVGDDPAGDQQRSAGGPWSITFRSLGICQWCFECSHLVGLAPTARAGLAAPVGAGFGVA